MKTKVIKVDGTGIYFDNGYMLSDYHDQDCCESHYLDFSPLELNDFDGYEFDLSNDNFFRRIEDYGIELIPIKGWGIRIAGYAENNGWYSSDLSLELWDNDKNIKSFDVSECQNDIGE